MKTLWEKIETGPNPPEEVFVIIENPKNNKNKYEFRKEGYLVLDRVLHSSVHFPGDYGLIPRTYYEDGDALDILVLITEPTFPGCVLPARPIGVLKMRDEKGRDDKILAVASGDPLYHDVYTLKDIYPHTLAEIAEFFRTYKGLEYGKNTEVIGWGSKEEAFETITNSMRLYNKLFANQDQ
ncbi:MAG: inorganic diphosphatase [Candidatus Heimdallarchaeum aukensis]|uniref:Inorganic pyrophosphatase n=1 Tax=Candidatus Heimdallarchaeum aukensis TaxID=2876573 RepID=A0A9Y1BJ05_9ARCH|nr:MAG: inorganic diphosphatase [Candidatus Heimdallarchaeum aukensis]